MATRMQQRRGTASQWTTANPILAAGEIGFESDTGQFKIGDGTNHWEDLVYFKNVEDTGFNAEDYVSVTLLGEPLGVATLDADGKLEPSQIPNIDEISQDAVNAALTAGNGISKDYNDAANTLTLSVDTNVIATKQYVNDEVASLVNGAPDLLNTLNELAAAINDDETFSETVQELLTGKLDDSQLGVTVASLVDGNVPVSQLFNAIDHTDSQIELLLEDTLIPLDARVTVVEDTKQDKVAGVSDSEIATLSDINTSTTVQAQINLKADATDLDGKANTVHTHSVSDIIDVSASASELNILDGATVSTTELNYLDGVTSGIQGQIDGKANSIHTHPLSDIVDVTATSSEVNILDGATVTTEELNILDGATISTTELNYLDGVTSAVQTQLNNKAASSHTHLLSSITDVTATATEVNYLSGADSNIQDQIDGKAASIHTHTVSQITDITVDAAAINSLDGVQGNVQDQLDDKSDVGHTHTLSNVVDVTASFTEVNYLVGTSSNVQDQIDSKQDEITGAASTVVSTDLSASKVVVSNASGKIDSSSVTAAELGHLSGVTSSIQSQIDGKSAIGHNHATTDIAGLNASATELNYMVGVSSSVQTQLNGKASSSHTHVISDVTNLQSTLDSKLNLSGGTMTGDIVLVGAPTQANHPATKAYADSISEGLHIHPSCVAATTANVNLNNHLEAGDTLDGVVLVAGDRILVKNQNNPAQNGIYVVKNSGAPDRATDFDAPAEVDGGDFVFVTGGTINDNTGWVQTTVGITVIGTDPIEFTQFAGAGTIKAGTNISVDGNTVSTVLSPTFSSLTVTSDLTVQSGAAVHGLTLSNGSVDDVVISTASQQDVLVHNGTNWVNRYINAIPTKISQGTVTSNNYNLVAADNGKIVEISSSSATTVTIPSNESFDVGTMIVVSQTGAGQITIVVENPATQTLNSTPGSKLRAQWSVATLLKRSANTWMVYGDLVA